MINRGFERLKVDLRPPPGATRSTARGAIYLAWIVVSVLALAMFQLSPRELAPTEDQGVIFGVVNTPANSTLDQLTPDTRAVLPGGLRRSRSPTSPSRSPSPPAGSGAWG